VGVSPECIGVSSGSEHLIDFLVQFFLGLGDEAVSIMPSFFMYEKRVWLSGAKLIAVPLKPDLSLDVDGILKKVSEKTRLIFVCSPNNPTGNEFSWESVEALADGCSAIVIVDEAYTEFGDCSICREAVEKENIIAVRTFSKAFGLAGLRFGYFVANRNLASALSEAIPYTVSTVVARFVERLLNRFDVVKGWIEQVKSERERLIKELRSIGGVEVFDSKANFVTFKPKADVGRVYKGLLERGIVVKDLGDLPVIGHCLRVTVGLPLMNDKFLNVLKQVLKENGHAFKATF
jgi:histidinol-phosphate aminotransferase